jgi:hypothetical protein
MALLLATSDKNCSLDCQAGSFLRDSSIFARSTDCCFVFLLEPLLLSPKLDIVVSVVVTELVDEATVDVEEVVKGEGAERIQKG